MKFLAHRLPLALLLARLAIGRTFRHSGLGPLWSTVGVALAVATVGLLFGTILRRQLNNFEDYVEALASGLVMWTFVSAVVGETSIAFARWMPILRHSPVTIPIIALSVVLRHLPVLIVNLVLFLCVRYAVLGRGPAPLDLAGATALLLLNVGWMAAVTMVAGARFRDIGQLVANLMQIAFLLTPILWPSYFLGRFEYLLLFNPFHHLVAIFNGAAQGTAVPTVHWLVAVAMAVAGNAGAIIFFRWCRHRWPYWI